MNFEKFSGYGQRISRKISITKSYTFGIPPTFFKDNGIASFNYVAIYFNREEKVVGLHFNNEEGFKLVKYGVGDKQGATFPAKSFFLNYRLDPNIYKGHYDAEKIVKDGIGILYLIRIIEKS